MCQGSLAAGKMLLGQLYDKVGTRRATFISNGATALGLCTMLVASFSPALIPIVLCQGLAVPLARWHTPLSPRRFSASRITAPSYGIISAMGRLGGALAPVFAASVYDATGSYKGCLFGHGSGAGGNQRGLWENLP